MKFKNCISHSAFIGKMKYIWLLLGSAAFQFNTSAQTNSYKISFENAVHHEAFIQAVFPDLSFDTITLRMSRTSPGRYALHEFARNVYNLEATDGKGNPLAVLRPNPYQWKVTGHDGTVRIRYTLFGDRCDGTYTQIDETHAHLNIPATFIYVPKLNDRKMELEIQVRADLDWKVATQLPKSSENIYFAPDLAYFMDSPIEISNYDLNEFEVESNGKKYKIRFVLHHNGTEEEFDKYFEKVKIGVLGDKEIFDEFPDFDYGIYTFLACYLPHAIGDGMEHRNSTILTANQGLLGSTIESKLRAPDLGGI